MEYKALLFCLIVAVIITPLVKKLAIKIGATDQPNHRKVHKIIMPRLGGLAIYISFALGILFFFPESNYTWPVLIGATVIIITGVLDDLTELSAKLKLFGQLLAAVIVVMGGVQVDFINLPFGGQLDLGYLSIPITILWIIAITNAINLIDGLDGLAAGVSAIALLTISGMAITMGNVFVVFAGLMMLGSTLGFLVYNFYPAKIFMGDTGALFLGFMISVLALLGFKNVTLFSFVIPIIILGVPISDTLFAIVRRVIQRKPLSAPDKSHLHHCLINLGYSHPEAVLMIYAVSALFSLAAVIFSQATIFGAISVIALLAVMIELIVEITGLVGKEYRPLLNMINGTKSKQ
ncbi:undecaprenyl/decaprenyl-phosphate alpha-N-acetylglucosaminyl 1-phosphate transferase [Halobacillus litoralis]|uniref:Undecaprenyl/decaprenyl-phosphate alpha-N-acetylglucosaminyl 1-phosphate transferase n=1 Tax=Halobacillus litoralis TaxID=45668 RepID=A0A845F873_9BACI|nr:MULTISPECIES: MraY family glycosyltransferase [Halobacillus]MBN9655922.1 undecaprenyl/decaprenyl-phosphate alpha-N-acetylglucosaminyl 1-phosphate transferase [Halobacillus sp. GSS1]MEC3882789.1 MraY family glycosyltransferase [Halobacillus sp. HZG1]MYL69994.1 undecaprenyl/decaprenyl-phosphate alpha-N-acetylglucosaminyl 1-phosphate transferase [Halobacillus litoralis]